jgi:GNAT superfamily N-acetyltransferase
LVAARLVTLHAKADIEAFARKNTFLHLYEIGDLDDFYWPHTVWYGWCKGEQLQQLALVYTALSTPVLLSYGDPPRAGMRDFLRALLPLLPRQLFAHLYPGAADVMAEQYQAEFRGLHWKMGLADTSAIHKIYTEGVVPLSTADLPALQCLYAEAYPENVFDRQMLNTGQYYGIREGSTLVSIAGLHAFSPAYKVAAIGNVATHPNFRRQGFSTKVCAALCQRLLREVTHIGLNVRADNAAAISVYRRLGFKKVAEFGAYSLAPRSP